MSTPRYLRQYSSQLAAEAYMEDRLLKMKAQGKSWIQIGKTLGISPAVCSIRYDKYLDPALNDWTEEKMDTLDSLVEKGLSWGQIGAKLGSSARQCYHIWKIRGKGHYKFRAILNVSNTEHWTQHEVETFWRAWFQEDQHCLRAAAYDMPGRTSVDCHKGILYFVKKAVEDAPGWAQIEIMHFVSQAMNNARVRSIGNRAGGQGMSDNSDRPKQTTPSKTIAPTWTPEEHDALLKAVEEHGLFANWDDIRDAVKPTLKTVEVEKEYWRLSGMAEDEDGDGDDDNRKKSANHNIRSDKHDSLNWSREEVEALNLMLMKYGTLECWKRLADEKHIKPTPLKDLEQLFGGKTIPTTTTATTEDGSRNEENRDEKGAKSGLWDIVLRDRLRFLVEHQRHRTKASADSEDAIDWAWTADHIGPGVTVDDCKKQWSMIDQTRSVVAIRKPSQTWSEEELQLLTQAISTIGKRWVRIRAEYFPHRSTDSIRRKFRLFLDLRKPALEEPIRRDYKDDPVLLQQKLEELEATNAEYAFIMRLARAPGARTDGRRSQQVDTLD
ncbi:hypothetical protein BGZ73_003600 [Actinomortierella ambigua]|nr:hypothetical protein BGZ73_003600 [Actinomortierella ambigua]